MCCKPEPHEKIWWHWIMEICPKCKFHYSQKPVWDVFEEDIRLFTEIEEYREHQREEEKPYLCDHCKVPLYLGYNHAIVGQDPAQKIFKEV